MDIVKKYEIWTHWIVFIKCSPQLSYKLCYKLSQLYLLSTHLLLGSREVSLSEGIHEQASDSAQHELEVLVPVDPINIIIIINIPSSIYFSFIKCFAKKVFYALSLSLSLFLSLSPGEIVEEEIVRGRVSVRARVRLQRHNQHLQREYRYIVSIVLYVSFFPTRFIRPFSFIYINSLDDFIYFFFSLELLWMLFELFLDAL